MKNKILKVPKYSSLFVVIALSLSIAQIGFAEDGQLGRNRMPPIPRPAVRLQEVRDLRNNASTSPKTIRKEIQGVRKDLREDNQAERKDMRSDVKDIRDDMRNGSTTREEGLQEMRDRFEEGRKNIRLNRGQASSTIEKLRIELFAREFKLVIARLNAGVERLETIANRIDSRVAKLDQNGANTTDAKTKLAEARVKISQAKADIDLVVIPSSTAPLTKDQMNGVKKLIQTAKKSIKSAHEALYETIKILKKIPKPAETASSTSQNDN